YHFDLAGSLDGTRLGNGATNLSQFDALNHLTNSIWKSNQLTLASFAYQLGKTGNRTNLTQTLFTSITNRSYNWLQDALYRLISDSYDNDGNTIWSTNGGVATGPFYYEIEDRLTNFNSAVYLVYNGDGIRVKKTVGATNLFFLADDRNPTGYAQVLEEWSAA